jgi:hypothetical protein
MNNDKLAQDILEAYGTSVLFAELVVYRFNDDQVIRDTIAVDFSDNDYQYQTNVKPIYTE